MGSVGEIFGVIFWVISWKLGLSAPWVLAAMLAEVIAAAIPEGHLGP